MDSDTIQVPQQKTTNANGGPLPFNLTDLDRATLAQTDEEFIPHSWEELKDIVGLCCLSSSSWMIVSRCSFGHSHKPVILIMFLICRSE